MGINLCERHTNNADHVHEHHVRACGHMHIGGKMASSYSSTSSASVVLCSQSLSHWNNRDICGNKGIFVEQ